VKAGGKLCTLISCLAYPSALNKEAACSSEILADFQLPMRRYIPEDRPLHNHRCENLNPYILVNKNFTFFIEELGIRDISSFSSLKGNLCFGGTVSSMFRVKE
jgi:hypothetical protein